MIEDIAEKLGLARVSIRLPGSPLQTIIERSPVTILLGGYDIGLPPGAFLQATRQGQELLTQAALEYTQGAAKVADLFCGIGTYSFSLSRSAKVLAVESDEAMVLNLYAHIKLHAIATLKAQPRDLFKTPLAAAELKRFDAAVINPPRLGAKAQTRQLAESGIGTIVMISCNPATFARDARMLTQAGYRLGAAFGVDQFVYSAHLEIVAAFRR